MATVPIVTEVTKAQLDALVAANGLNEGLQYKVTDKDWLLVATTSSTLSPISGVLLMDNTQKPTYINADVLLKDTGIVIDSILEIINETGYIPVSAYLNNLVSSGEDFTVSVAGSIFLNISPSANYKSYLIPVASNGIPNYEGQIFVDYANNESPGYRLILKFEKSPL